ncbi:zinc transporter ZIP1-like [Portunus trituberculatus]|uniref:zinc transporter ZIP1-like n=1 Tax=Portunus trituberculatus TaxID=210409 RepID=UPI001E1CF0DA|nr:zinc transporter ZIP1-like [Portunus trituberculatus]
MLSLVATKAVVLVLMLVLTMAMGLLPLYVYRMLTKRLNQVALSISLCFGAGVLLSIVFLHLLPETQENFRFAMEEELIQHTSYPVAEVAVCSGFFLVYLMEEVIHGWVAHQKGDHDPQETHEGPATVEEAQKEARARRRSNRVSELRHSTSSVLGVTVIKEVKGYLNGSFEEEEATPDSEKNGEASSSVHIHHRQDQVNPGLSLVGTLMVVTALSFHGVMEGLAIGLEESIRDIWTLFAALCCHKVILAFSMSMELLQAGMKLCPFLISVSIFAFASPLGGLIGALVAGFSDQESVAGILSTTLLQAVSGGAILYVTFCEVLERERTKPMNGFLKFLALLVGFGIMAGLEAVSGHEHGHHDSGSNSDMTTTSPVLCSSPPLPEPI